MLPCGGSTLSQRLGTIKRRGSPPPDPQHISRHRAGPPCRNRRRWEGARSSDSVTGTLLPQMERPPHLRREADQKEPPRVLNRSCSGTAEIVNVSKTHFAVTLEFDRRLYGRLAIRDLRAHHAARKFVAGLGLPVREARRDPETVNATPYRRRVLRLWLDKFAKHGNGVALVPERTSMRWRQG